MTRRGGMALPAVLAALVIMSMIVAVGAQRALVAVRQGGAELAKAELSVAVAAAQAAALEAAVDSVRRPLISPGELLTSGEEVAGSARARWELVEAAFPFAVVEIEAEAPLFRGLGRERYGAVIVPRRDSAGTARWATAGGGGWIRLPTP